MGRERGGGGNLGFKLGWGKVGGGGGPESVGYRSNQKL